MKLLFWHSSKKVAVQEICDFVSLVSEGGDLDDDAENILHFLPNGDFGKLAWLLCNFLDYFCSLNYHALSHLILP